MTTSGRHENSRTTKELVHQAVRRRVLQNLPLRSVEGEDLVPISKGVLRSWGHRGFTWMQCRQIYDLRPRASFRMTKIDDKIGVGLRATRNLRSGVEIEGAVSMYGRHISQVVSDRTDLGVKRDLLWKKRRQQPQMMTMMKKKYRSQQIYNLHGPLAYINHACSTHANCIHYIQGDRKTFVTTMWKKLSTIRPIKKDEELTVCYDEDDCDYACRECDVSL